MIRQKLTYGSKYAAIEYANQSCFHFLSLKKKKNELLIEKKENFSTEEDLFQFVKGQKHLFLVLNNEQALTKEVNFSHIAKESVVKTAFPNISLKDFYYDVIDNSSSSIVSICRKEVVDRIIKQFQEKGISIVQFSLGNSSFQKLLPFLNDYNFHTSNSSFNVQNQNVERWGKNQGVKEVYDVNGLTIESDQLLTLAGVLSYCNGIKTSKEDDSQLPLIKEYQQRRLFTLGLKGGLGFIFAILLVNFFVFSSYRNTASVLTEELAMNEVYRKQLLSMTDLVSKKKRLVESMNAVSNSKVLWYIDQLANSVPGTISLNDINYQPVSRSIKKNKDILFDTDEIFVKGISKDNTDFVNWINQLEKRDWIQRVATKNLGGGDSKFSTFEFIIYMKRSKE